MSQINPGTALLSHSLKVYFHHPMYIPGLPSGLLPSGFPTRIPYFFRFSHMRATCPAHHTLTGFIAIITFGEQ